MDSLFKELSTSYRRKKFIAENMGYIKPEKVTLSTTVSASDDLDLNENSSYGYYVPMEKSLKKLLEYIPDKSLNFNFRNNLKSDVFDGNYMKKLINSMNQENTLSFCIYCDDIEMVNPIGSNRKVHKLSKFRENYTVKSRIP